jgi:ATP-binding cassette subfamily F protein 3
VSLIAFNGVAFDYAGVSLFSDIGFAVERAERWGVIGRNGSGKTTLFRLAAGTLTPTKGSVSREGGLRITLLDQHRVFENATTVWQAAASPFAHLQELECALEAQARALEHDASPDALARYDRDLHRFERDGGYTFRATVDAVLEGLGFTASDARTQRLESLSGGERGRVGLARQLAAPGDILLLDEPTNHLDLETTRWLEEHLRSSGATVLVISHDRAFLDGVTDHILHIESGTACAYAAGYAHFVEIRNERRDAQLKSFSTQQRKIAAEEDYIRRNIAGQNSRQAKGRRTRLARLPRLSPPPSGEGVMALQLRARERGGDQVLVAHNVRLEVGTRILLDGFTGRVTRGETVGIVGPNGAGKSTLLRVIAGERAAEGGSVDVGGTITVAHYRQDLAQVPVDKSLFDTIHDLRPLWDRGQVQGHLGKFGFSGNEVRRITGTLSGGEQARLALAMIVLTGANLLLFDEPTNHLDVESIEALEDALEAYDGTVVLVSHDRALLETLTTRTWALYGGRMEDFVGPFGEWVAAKATRDRLVAQQAALEEDSVKRREKEKARRLDTERRAQAADVRALQRTLETAEARVHALELLIAELTRRLHDAALYSTADGAVQARALQMEIERARVDLDAALEAWAAAEEEAAAIEPTSRT